MMTLSATFPMIMSRVIIANRNQSQTVICPAELSKSAYTSVPSHITVRPGNTGTIKPTNPNSNANRVKTWISACIAASTSGDMHLLFWFHFEPCHSGESSHIDLRSDQIYAAHPRAERFRDDY